MIQRRQLLVGMAGVACAGPLLAQQWPVKPVRVITPYPPGGATDITARIYAQHLTQLMGQPFVIENRAGAGGEIGATAVANSPGDGYSLLFGAIGSLAIHAVIPTQKPPYELMTALTGVSMGSSVPLAIAVRGDLGANSINELIKLSKTGGKGLTFGSAGNGSTQHMTGEYFQQTASTKMTHVPYKGSGPAVADLLGGQIDLVFETLPALASQVSSGKLRILAVTSDKRSDMLPNVPTLKEAGFPDFEVTTYYGLLAPKSTPPAIVAQLSKTMQEISKMPEVRQALQKQGADAFASTPETTTKLIQSEVSKWGQVQKLAQVQ